MKFSKFEIKELVKAWLAISLVFGIAMTGISPALAIAIPIALLTAGVGFLFHELAHKFVAQRFRCWAEFRADTRFLIISIIIAFFGVVFAAPGAVIVRGANRVQHGKIAVAGPLTNIVLAFLFFLLTFITNEWAIQIGRFGFTINAFLAVFNLLPIPPFDGRAVFVWNKFIWVGSMAMAGITLFFAFF